MDCIITCKRCGATVYKTDQVFLLKPGIYVCGDCKDDCNKKFPNETPSEDTLQEWLNEAMTYKGTIKCLRLSKSKKGKKNYIEALITGMGLKSQEAEDFLNGNYPEKEGRELLDKLMEYIKNKNKRNNRKIKLSELIEFLEFTLEKDGDFEFSSMKYTTDSTNGEDEISFE